MDRVGAALVAAAVLASVAAGLAVVPGEATALSCESTWNGDLYQSEGGDWYVLNAQRTGDPIGESRVEIHRYSSDWTERGVVSGTLDNTTTPYDDAPDATDFGPASDGGWWLETDENGYYRVDETLAVTETRPASAERPEGLRRADEREVDAAAVNEGWEVDGVFARYRGQSGDIWTYGPDRVYRYTGWGQYTGQSHPVGKQSVGCSLVGYGYILRPMQALAGAAGVAVAIAGIASVLAAFVLRRHFVSIAATLVVSGGVGKLFYDFALPWPLSVVYWLPNPIIATVLATPAAVLLWWLRRGDRADNHSVAVDAVLAATGGGLSLLVGLFFLLRF